MAAAFYLSLFAAMATLRASHQQPVSAASLLTEEVQALVKVAPLNTVISIPDLPFHQQATKNQGQLWLDEVLPRIDKSVTTILDYAKPFNTTYDQLMTLFENGTNASFAQFGPIKENLHKDLTLMMGNGSNVSAVVWDYWYKFRLVRWDINHDYYVLSTDITTRNQTIKDLEANITHLRAELNDPTLNQSQRAAIEAQIKTDTDEIARLSAELVQLNQVLVPLKNYVDSVFTVVALAEAVAKWWDTGVAWLQGVLTALETFDVYNDKTYVLKHMSDAGLCWNGLLETVHLLM